MASRRRPCACRYSTDRRPHLFMGETDQHVDRRRRQIPGLDHRDAGGQQAPAARRRPHDPGQHDAVRPTADDRVEQRVLPRLRVPALAEHQLVARLGQPLGQRLNRLEKDRAGDRRDDRGHQPAAGRGKAPGEHVRHIAGPLDRFPHPPQRFSGHLIRRIERARRRDRRDPGELCDVGERDASGPAPGAALARRGGGRAGRHGAIIPRPVRYRYHNNQRPTADRADRSAA